MIGGLELVLTILVIWFSVSVLVGLFVAAFIRSGAGPKVTKED